MNEADMYMNIQHRPGLLRPRIRICALLAGLMFVWLPQETPAQAVSKVGTTAAEFLQIGIGPRAMAMGGSFVAGVDDASALYWNPGGLGRLAKSEVLVSHSEWLADINHDYLGVALSLGASGTLGISITLLGVPDMMVRTEDRQDGTGEYFNASDLAVGLSYGRRITDRFSVGGTVKFIRQRIWHSSASGFAFDLGTQFQTDFLGGMVIGASLYNFGSDMRLGGRDLRTFVDPDLTQQGNNERIPVNYELEIWSLPLNFQIGVSTTAVQTAFHTVTVSIDALHPSSNHEMVNAGVEYGFQNRVFLRGGYRALLLDWRLPSDDEIEGGLSAGIGVRQTLFYGGAANLDYAFRTGGRLGGIHIVGLAVTF